MFLAASPRIPDDVREVTLIVRRDELVGVKEFPAVPERKPVPTEDR